MTTELEAQRARALAQANATRRYRWQLHMWLTTAPERRMACYALAGLLDADELPAELATLRAGVLLGWVRPPGSVPRLLAAAGASEMVTVGRLTARQRHVLARLLCELAPPPDIRPRGGGS